MTQLQLHEEFVAFVDLLADRLAAKLAETLPAAFADFKQRGEWASLQARARAEMELGKMIEAASIREAETAAEAERKREARAELERTIDRALLTSQELDRFLAGGPEPGDYEQRVALKQEREEEKQLMTADATLLSSDEMEAYLAGRGLPPGYRDRALKAREKGRQQKRFALVLDNQQVLSAEERERLQFGVIPPDFEQRLEKVETVAAPRGTGNFPGAELRGR